MSTRANILAADLKERAEDADAAYGIYEKPGTESTRKMMERDEDADAAYGVYAPPDSSN